MEKEEQSIKQTYREYVEAFMSLKPSAVLPFYNVPCMMISSQLVRVLLSEQEIEATFAQTMEKLKKASYDRTEIINLTVNRKGDGVAMVNAGLERYSAGGEKIGSHGGVYRYTYTLQKAKDRWRVVAVLSHDPEYP